MKIALLLSLISFNCFATLLPENIYEKNEDIKIIKNKLDEIKNKTELANNLLYSSKLNIQNYFTFSKDNSTSPLYKFNTLKNNQFQISLNKQLQNGILVEAGQSYQINRLTDLEFLNVTDFSYTDKDNSKSHSLIPFIGFQIPLLNNYQGEKLKQVELINDLNLDFEYLNSKMELDSTIYLIDQIIAEYLILKHRVKSTKSSLDRTNKIFNSIKRRVDLNIEELNSLLQVKALKESTEAELFGLKAIEKDFEDKIIKLEIPIEILNSFVIKDLNELQLILFQKIVETATTAKKAQTLLNEKSARLSSRNSELQALENKPSLNLNLKINNQSTGASLNSATKEYTNFNKPEIVVGFNFNLELDQKSNQQLTTTALKIAKLEEQRSIRALKNSQDELELLLTRLKAKHNVFSKYKEVLKTQNDKLNYENKLLASGRSGVFQVLQFEQDLYRQELTQTQLLQELFSLHNDLALFKY